jgi:predicted O-linked N-acetylglucosamine transferase (SPINDLY family)
MSVIANRCGALIQPHRNSRDAERRLRIGYVSPDFRQHVVGWNLLPLLRHHDREQFEIFCCSSVTRPDAMTEQLRACAHQTWEVHSITIVLLRRDYPAL